MKILLLFLLLFSFHKLYPQDSAVDSLFALVDLDTSGFKLKFLVRDIHDSASYKFHQNADSTFCTDYLIFAPMFTNKISSAEYDSLIKYSPKENEDYFFDFLTDNSIHESLNKVYADSTVSNFMIERLSTEVHINFGKKISTSIFKNGLLRYYFNNDCARRLNFESHRFFFYAGNEVAKEIQIIKVPFSDTEIKIWQNEN